MEKQLKEFEVPLSGKRIRLTKEFSPKELSILADKIRITEVINNLLSNAVKFTPEDGVIKLSAYPADIFVKLEVANTGSGIPVEQLPKVFDKFEKMGVAKEGTGLGLAIAKDIVELHDGRIWVESEPGKNTTFFVLLPRHNGE